jgi:hypothetical protein
MLYSIPGLLKKIYDAIVSLTGKFTVDSILGYLTTIGTEHDKVHGGGMFRRCNMFASIDNNANGDVLLVTGSKTLHAKIVIKGGGDSIGYLYEAPIVSSNGTALPIPANFNRPLYSTLPEFRMFYTPTIDSPGAFLCAEYVPGGRGGNSLGGSARDDVEWILKANTRYLIRHTNVAGSAKRLFENVEGYEV